MIILNRKYNNNVLSNKKFFIFRTIIRLSSKYSDGKLLRTFFFIIMIFSFSVPW